MAMELTGTRTHHPRICLSSKSVIVMKTWLLFRFFQNCLRRRRLNLRYIVLLDTANKIFNVNASFNI